MQFEDFGVVSWFNGSFGVVLNPKNKEIFIHERKIISGAISQGHKVLIGTVRQNTAKDRLDGSDVLGFNEQQKSEFLDIILSDWISKAEIKFDATVLWLLEHGDTNCFKRILDHGFDYWILSSLFNKWARGNINKFSPFVHQFVYDRWSVNKAIDMNLVSLFKCEDENVITDLITNNINIIYNPKFEELTKFIPNRYKEYIYEYVISNISVENEESFSRDINWLLIYRSQNEINKIVNIYKELLINRVSILDVIVKHSRVLNSMEVNDLVLSYWKRKGIIEFDIYIDYLIRNSGLNQLFEAVNTNPKYWYYNENYLERLKNYYWSNDLTIQLLFLRLKKEIENSSSTPSDKILPSELSRNHLYWLLMHTDLIEFERSFGRAFVADRTIIDVIITKNYRHNIEVKERYLFDCWKCLINEKYEQLENWIEKNVNLDILINYISLKYNYNIELVLRWYQALFPGSDPQYFLKRVKESDWGNKLSGDYLKFNLEKIRSRFLELFIVHKDIVRKEVPQKTVHSATDLASFQYCPASYVLAATFDISMIDNDSMFIGREEHKKIRLLSFKKRDEFIDQSRYYGDSNEYREFVSLIARSQCTFEGHSEDSNETIIFYSEKGKISMVPDYLFKCSETEFIVEEKFTTTEFDKISDLYLNHKIQALAYLYGMPNPNISGVFVVYWFYDLKNRKVSNSRIFKIHKTEANKNQLLNIFESVEKLNRGEVVQLKTSDINVNKCVKCRAFSICKYKTGEYNSIKFE